MDYAKQIKIESDLCHKTRERELNDGSNTKDNTYISNTDIVSFSRKYNLKNNKARIRNYSGSKRH